MTGFQKIANYLSIGAHHVHEIPHVQFFDVFERDMF